MKNGSQWRTMIWSRVLGIAYFFQKLRPTGRRIFWPSGLLQFHPRHSGGDSYWLHFKNQISGCFFWHLYFALTDLWAHVELFSHTVCGSQTMPSGTYTQKHELANKRTFTAIPRQQTNRIQGNTATHLDIRDWAMGMQQAIQHKDPPNIPIKNAQNDQQCPLVRLLPNLAQWIRNPVRNRSG